MFFISQSDGDAGGIISPERSNRCCTPFRERSTILGTGWGSGEGNNWGCVLISAFLPSFPHSRHFCCKRCLFAPSAGQMGWGHQAPPQVIGDVNKAQRIWSKVVLALASTRWALNKPLSLPCLDSPQQGRTSFTCKHSEMREQGGQEVSGLLSRRKQCSPFIKLLYNKATWRRSTSFQ